jgi:hypothetical protein
MTYSVRITDGVFVATTTFIVTIHSNVKLDFEFVCIWCSYKQRYH